MKAIIQRVSSANCEVKGKIISQINRGYLVLLGVEVCDNEVDVEYISNKISNLRIWSDDTGKLQNSIIDIKGEILLISQFTLMANTSKGNRPSFTNAEKPEIAKNLYQKCGMRLSELTKTPTKYGVFGDMMNISLVNDGPFTISIDSRSR